MAGVSKVYKYEFYGSGSGSEGFKMVEEFDDLTEGNKPVSCLDISKKSILSCFEDTLEVNCSYFE